MNWEKGWAARLLPLAALLPALMMQSVWLMHNTQLPVADADGMLSNSYLIAQHAVHHEWGQFFAGLYLLRDWRPTALYILEVPFQLIGGGNQMFTASAVTLLCTAITCVYIYRLLRLSLERVEAVLGTMMLSLLSFNQWPAAYFGFTEIAFLPAVLATVYHLIKSDSLRIPRHAVYFAIAASVAFLMRPVESLTHIAPVFALFLAASWRRKIVSKAQIYLIVTIAMIGASVLMLAGLFSNGIEPHSEIFADAVRGHRFVWIGKKILAATGLFVAGAGGHYAYIHRQTSGGFCSYAVPAFTAISIVVVSFYFGFVPGLVEWIYACSVGGLAATAMVPPVWVTLQGYLFGAGLLPFVGVSLIGAFSFVWCMSSAERKRLLRHPLLYLLSFIPLTLLMTLTSVQVTQRKVTVVLSGLLLVFMVPCLTAGRWRSSRVGAIAIILAAQVVGLWWLYTGHPNGMLVATAVGSPDGFPTMVTIRPNPHFTVGDFLARNAEVHGYKTILVPIVTNKPDPIDPFLLGTVMVTGHRGVDVTFPYIPTYDGPYSIPKVFAARDADAFIIISDEDRPMIQSQAEAERLTNLNREQKGSPNDKMANDLLALYAANRIGSIGGNKVDCTIIAPTRFEACLFAINKVR